MAIVASDFDKNHEYYFNAPQKFKGNKLNSYGGNLTFTIRFEGTTTERTKPLDIILLVRLLMNKKKQKNIFKNSILSLRALVLN